MKLSDAGRKVWERPYHPFKEDQREAISGNIVKVKAGDVPGVPFGWVVAKDCLQGLLSAGPVGSEDVPLAITQAIALCNALAEEGL